jgi:hypothetical protein
LLQFEERTWLINPKPVFHSLFRYVFLLLGWMNEVYHLSYLQHRSPCPLSIGALTLLWITMLTLIGYLTTLVVRIVLKALLYHNNYYGFTESKCKPYLTCLQAEKGKEQCSSSIQHHPVLKLYFDQVHLKFCYML